MALTRELLSCKVPLKNQNGHAINVRSHFFLFFPFFFLVFINGFSESLSNFTNWFQHCFLTRFSNVIFNTLFITFNCVSIFIAGDRFLLNIWQFFDPNIIPLVRFHLNILYFIRYIYRNIPLKMEKFKKQVIKKK